MSPRLPSCRRALLLAALVLWPSLAAAQSRTDFTGRWVLAPDKSDFGSPQAAMTGRTDVMTQTADSLTVVRTQATPEGPAEFLFRYALDGKEHVNIHPNQEVRSVIGWDGPVMVMTSKVKVPAADIDVVDRYTLSTDGQTLVIQRHMMVPGRGELHQTLVMEKR